MSSKNETQWSSKLGFILSVIGSTVGLGSIWRFSIYSYENGGGAFLIVYLILMTVLGLPLLIFEFGLGNQINKFPPSLFGTFNPNWKWVGWLSLFIGCSIFGFIPYYTVVISWCVLYLKHSLWWGKDGEVFEWGADPGSFFEEGVLNATKTITDIGSYQLHLIIAIGITWFLIWFILHWGLNNGLELANKIFIPLLFLCTIFLLIWSLTLDGASKGVYAYLSIDPNYFFNIKSWFTGAHQALFSLSVVIGVMLVFSKFLPEKSDLVTPAIITTYGTAFFAIFFGLIIFSILGYMSQETNVDIKSVVKGGPGLAFVTLTKAFNLLASDISAVLAKAVAFVFFFCLIIAGVSSALSMLEATIGTLEKEFNLNRQYCLNICILFGFILSAAFYSHRASVHWIDLLDTFITSYLLILSGLIHLILISWFTPLDNLIDHINRNSNIKIGTFWRISIKYICPAALFCILVSTIINHVTYFKEPRPEYAGYDNIILYVIFSILASIFLLSLFFQYIQNNIKKQNL